jgi:hypothetical protein
MKIRNTNLRNLSIRLTKPVIVQTGLLLNFDAATYSGSGAWIDSHAGVHATPYNNPAWSSDNDGIFTLNSSSTQYFSVPWPTFHPTFTIDMWFNYTGNQPNSACLISDEFTGAPFNFTILAAGNHVQTGWYNTNWTGQYATNNIPTALPTDGSTWYNLVMSVDTTTYKDYLNGTVSYDPGSYSAIGVGPPNGSSPTQRFFIGHRLDQAETVNAKIAVVNIYDRALTDAEVAHNYNIYKRRFGLN